MTDTSPPRAEEFAGLRAILFNCSHEIDPADSHTAILAGAVGDVMARAGVAVEHLHVATAGLAHGIYPDMTEHGQPSDAWPAIWPRVLAADILVIATPIWLGEESSLCRLLLERLYAMSGELNDAGQSVFYGKVGGTIVTGNEDGIKHVAMSTGFALNHLGLTIPPQADCGWIGEAGPGPSFGDEAEGGGRIGFDNDFTRRNATIMTWNLMHMAAMLRSAGGLPTRGNDRNAFSEGASFGFRLPGDTA